tara:strand:- start:456298 stop:457407 length:1110 start_codon:yes stop_codon:yes gene_type:complete
MNASYSTSKPSSLPDQAYDKPLILVPVYNPSPEFVPFIQRLHERALAEGLFIILVNDGSDAQQYEAAFKSIEALSQIRFIEHSYNSGKGAALKSGLHKALIDFPKATGVISADADGQHSVEDIFKVLGQVSPDEKDLILGVRQFEGAVPLRSLIGNKITRALFFMLTGVNITDTQTGLRFIPSAYFQQMLDIKSSGYAFEMEMLLWSKQAGVNIRPVPIHTIYIDDNQASHFRPFIDSVKIYAVLLRQVLSSSLTALVDLLVFALFFGLSGGALFWSNAFSRTVAFPVYYFMNRDFVFKQAKLGLHPMPKLIFVIIISGLFSYYLQAGVQQIFGWPEVLSKIIIETIVFFINFVVLRDFVYKNLILKIK